MSPIVDQWKIEMTSSQNLMTNGTAPCSTGREIFFLGHIVEALSDSNPAVPPSLELVPRLFPIM